MHMADSGDHLTAADRDLRRARKKLRQIEHLEHLGAGTDLRGHNVAKLAVLKIG